ncbi:MAG: dihydropteroate synthase [Ignavibacteria bacterium]|nr:dihydropteroate synthase [Ignavibacteria bacterium]
MINASKFPSIMGIVNVTPDSFSDGGMFMDTSLAIEHAHKLLEDGADIIDIGGESSRPGAKEIPIDEELLRVIPVIEGIRAINSSVKVSIDTVKYEVAEAALCAGASIINDISGLDNDKRLAILAGKHGAELIVMHMQGTPRTMQDNPHYDNVVQDVFKVLQQKIALAQSLGARYLMADVGIGFGKTAEHNWSLLKNLEYFHNLGVPIVLGLSRKSFLSKLLGDEHNAEKDVATLIVHALIPVMAANIIRVHNVEQMVKLKRIREMLL